MHGHAPGHFHSTASEFLKFCLVGSSGILLDTALLVGLVELGGLDPRLAAPFAFLVAATWNYGFNRTWTFALAPDTTIARSYVLFVLVSVGGFGVRLGVMHALIECAGMGDTPWYVADFRSEFRDALEDWARAGHRDPEITLWRTWPLPDGPQAEVYLVGHGGP